MLGMQNGMTTVEDHLVVLQIEHILNIWFSSYTPCDFPEGVENVKPHKNLPIGVYSSFLCNCQNLKQQRCPLIGE